MKPAIRIAGDDIGKGATAVDPELPPRVSHYRNVSKLSGN